MRFSFLVMYRREENSGNGRLVPLSNNYHDMSMFTSNVSDVDMSFA